MDCDGCDWLVMAGWCRWPRRRLWVPTDFGWRNVAWFKRMCQGHDTCHKVRKQGNGGLAKEACLLAVLGRERRR